MVQGEHGARTHSVGKEHEARACSVEGAWVKGCAEQGECGKGACSAGRSAGERVHGAAESMRKGWQGKHE